MHYYKRNLGDYAKKAGRLTMLQHGSYTLLIDACYDREQFPTLEQAIEWTWASTDAEIEAVKFVLDRFFRLDKDGQYVQPRILEELLEYHAKADKNKQIAIDRETKRKEKSTSRAPTVNEAPPNHKPITINQEPLTKNKEQRGSRLASDWVLLKSWGDWATAERPDLDIRRTADDFRDYWHSVAGAKGVKLDWQATWRVWVRGQKAQKPQIADIARQTVPSGDEYEQSKARVAKTFEGTRPPTKEEREALAAAINRMKVKS